MATHVMFQNPKTNETKTVKVGWSWVLFLFSGILGLPLFLRGLHMWGGIMAGLWGVNFIWSSLPATDEFSDGVSALILGLIGLGLQIWFGIKGNEMTAKSYLEKGWKMLDTDSAAAKHARSKWGLSEMPSADAESA